MSVSHTSPTTLHVNLHRDCFFCPAHSSLWGLFCGPTKETRARRARTVRYSEGSHGRRRLMLFDAPSVCATVSPIVVVDATCPFSPLLMAGGHLPSSSNLMLASAERGRHARRVGSRVCSQSSSGDPWAHGWGSTWACTVLALLADL